MSELFRSEEYEKGATRRLGSLHLHVDCSDARDVEGELLTIARACEEMGWPTKVTRIAIAQPGDHLWDIEFADVYAEHTPELCAGKNTFAAYLTALLSRSEMSAQETEDIFLRVKRFFQTSLRPTDERQIVMEVEKVICVVGDGTSRVAAPLSICSKKVEDTRLFEVHHFVDMPVDAAISFDEWAEQCRGLGIVVGGWFQFDKPLERAFRSLRFTRRLDMPDIVKEANAVNGLAKRITDKRVRVETVVEQIVEIWRV